MTVGALQGSPAWKGGLHPNVNNQQPENPVSDGCSAVLKLQHSHSSVWAPECVLALKAPRPFLTWILAWAGPSWVLFPRAFVPLAALSLVAQIKC